MIYFENGTVSSFNIILSTRTHEYIGQISNIDESSFSITCNLNSANELTFDVYKEFDGYTEPLWNEIIDLRLIYIKEIDEYFEINISYEDKVFNKKTITGTSLCACELSQVYLYNIEINTETDIERDDYVITTFYKENNETGSLLHRVLEKVPAYSIGHIDDSLKNIQRSFSISSSSIYDFLTGDCAKEFNCIFIFDTKTRTINAYDLYSVCMNNNCSYYTDNNMKMRYRNTFNDNCPICGSSNISYYGEDTTIYVSSENLTEDIKLTTDIKSVKNCFRLNGGDDNMTTAIMNINPNGSQYIYNFSPESYYDMPEELVQKLNDYNIEYNKYINTDSSVSGAFYPISLSTELVEKYNELVDKYKDRYFNAYNEEKKLINIENPIIGHSNLILHMYNSIDFYTYLKNVMMPRRDTADITAVTEVAKLNKAYTDGVISTFALSKLSSSTSLETINSSLLNYIKIYIKSGYVKLAISSSSISNGENNSLLWKGQFRITSYSDSDDVTYSNEMTITINDDYKTFLEEKILKTIHLNADDDQTVFEMFKIKDIVYFKNALKLYCSERIKSFYDAFQSAITILAEANQGTADSELYEDFYLVYYEKLKACEDELDKRNQELDIIIQYSMENDNSIVTGGIYKEIEDENNKIKKLLNLESYLGPDLYSIFSLYRREDNYENQNYISDGLNNEELIQNAIDFYEVAKNDLVTSSTYQHSISCNLYNLFAIPEFEIIKNKFKLGNWIRVSIDNNIYRLRLTKYEINFGNLTELNTEFSDMTKTADGMNDIQSLLSKTSSIASSFGAISKQSSSGKQASQTLNSWVTNGLNSAKTRINNNINQEVSINSNGILCKSYNTEINDYENEQMMITHNILAFTTDSWESTSTAIGKHHYTTYDILAREFIELEGYGINAQFVQSGQINGSQIIGGEIYSSNYEKDKYGSYYDLDRGYIYLNGEGTNKFSFDGKNLSITGSITATSLTLASGTKISPSDVDLSGYLKLNETIGNDDFNFNISSSGLLTATNAVINGTVLSKDENNRIIELSEGKLKIYGHKADNSKIQVGSLSCSGSKSTNIFNNFSILAGNESATLNIGKLSNSNTTDAYYQMNFQDTGYRHRFRDNVHILGQVQADDVFLIPNGIEENKYITGYPILSDSSNRVQLKWNNSSLELWVNSEKKGTVVIG